MANPSFQDGAGVGAPEQVDVSRMHAPIAREHSEPSDGLEPVPVPWILAALALAMVSGWYLGSQSGSFAAAFLDGDSQIPQVDLAAVSAPAPVDPLLVGRRIYNNCMACHQADGCGVEGQFPPLAGSEWVQGNERVLARILLHGMHGDVVVKNKHYNGVMPAWGRMNDDMIAAVLSYIRVSWDNHAGPISPEVIAAERSATARDSAWTASELLGNLP